MFLRFLHVRNLNADGDGGGGAPAAVADAPAAPAVVDTPAAPSADNNPPTQAQVNAAEANDILGGLPKGYDVPRGTSEPAPADKQPETPAAPAPAAATPPVVETPAAAAAPTFDFTKIGGGKFKDIDAINSALTAAETTSAVLTDPQVQAFVELAKDPSKAAEFFREIGRDYTAEAQANPYDVLLADFKLANPDYSDREAAIRFKKEYGNRYPDIDLNDAEDEGYQESVLLRDGDVSRAVKKLSAAQQAKRDELTASLPKFEAPTAAVPTAVVSDAEIQKHLDTVAATDAALTDWSLTVDVLDANGAKVGEEVIPSTLASREDVKLMMEDTFGYFAKAGIVDQDGNFNYQAYQQFAARAINHKADMQASLQRGIELGVKRGAAALIGAQPNNQQQPSASPIAAPGTPQAPAPGSYAAQQQQAAQNYPDY